MNDNHSNDENHDHQEDGTFREDSFCCDNNIGTSNSIDSDDDNNNDYNDKDKDNDECRTNNRDDERWNYYFNQLYNHHMQKTRQHPVEQQHNNNNNEHNDANNTPSSYNASSESILTNKKLYKWITNQRRYILSWEKGDSSPLTKHKMTLLNSIDFWNLYSSKFDILWNTRFDELELFYRIYGHLNVKSVMSHCNNSKSSNDNTNTTNTNNIVNVELLKRLDNWMIKQRQEYTKFEFNTNTTTSMTSYRIHKLESIGFIWNNRSDYKFDMKLRQLQEFKNIHGHLNIPQNHPGLGRWVARIRQLYHSSNDDNPSPTKNNNNNTTSSLTKERIQVLNDLGFEWKSTLKGSAYNNTWEKRYVALIAFKEQNGHCNVPKNYKLDQELGAWVRNQRTQYMNLKKGKKSPMSNDRIVLLEKIGFQWILRCSSKRSNAMSQEGTGDKGM